MPTASDALVRAMWNATNGPTVSGKRIATSSESKRDRASETAHRNVSVRSDVIVNCVRFKSREIAVASASEQIVCSEMIGSVRQL